MGVAELKYFKTRNLLMRVIINSSFSTSSTRLFLSILN